MLEVTLGKLLSLSPHLENCGAWHHKIEMEAPRREGWGGGQPFLLECTWKVSLRR
jgi:hypothetical protein